MSIPITAAVWLQAMDPTDQIDYVADFMGATPLLDVGETIAGFTVALMPEAVLLGVMISSGSGRDPVLIAGTAIKIWLEVQTADREDPEFTGKGVVVGVVFTITTTSSPSRRRQRTFALSVAQL